MCNVLVALLQACVQAGLGRLSRSANQRAVLERIGTSIFTHKQLSMQVTGSGVNEGPL